MSISLCLSLIALAAGALLLFLMHSLYYSLEHCESRLDAHSKYLLDTGAKLTKLTSELGAMKPPQESANMSLEQQRMLLLQEMSLSAEKYWQLMQKLRDSKPSA